jgi:uncharacterized protein YjbJ (UPF0337 family)
MNVNKDVFENKWEQIRAQSKAWWGLFSEDDLNKIEKADVKSDKYTMMLRVKYGYTHERAQEEINKRIAELESNPPSSELMQASLDRQASSKAPKVRKRRTKSYNS